MWSAKPLLLALSVVALLLVGCDSDSEETAPSQTAIPTSTQVITPTPDTVFAPGDPSPELASSLENLLKYTGTVIVGTVLSNDGQRDYPWPSIAGLPTTPPSPATTFTIRVDRVIVSDTLSQGQEIAFVQQGGRLSDGRLYVDSIAGRLLEVSATQYLLFLNAWVSDGKTVFSGPALGRFEIREGLIVPNGYADAGVLAITGLTFDEVRLARQDADPKAALASLAKVTIDEAAYKVDQSINSAAVTSATTGVD